MRNWKILITDGLAEKGQTILRQDAQVNDLTGILAKKLLEVIGE